MAPKKPYKPKNKKPIQPTAMYPNLHEDISNALADEDITPAWWFNSTGDDHNTVHTRETYIMGRFTCRNKNCAQTGWGSGKIFVQIRAYAGNGYNALVYKQRCRSCNGLGVLRLDENCYVERVVYWLKKWSGVEVEKPPHGGEKTTPPHEDELCEACKRGYCQRATDGGAAYLRAQVGGFGF